MDANQPAVVQDSPLPSAESTASRFEIEGLFRGALSLALARWEVWPLAGFALALTFVYLEAASTFGLPFDDSYISLQFARNLADHGFLTFDGDTASAGATSLLHIAVLAVPIKLGVEPVKASVAVGIALHLSLVLSVYWLGWSLFKDRIVASLSAASVGVIGYLVLDALNGMETTLFLTVSTAAVATFFGGRSERTLLVTGVLVAFAVLSRPEGVLLLGAIGLYYIVDPKRNEVLTTLPAVRKIALLAGPTAVVLVGLAVFYWSTTGSLTPGTATAKLLFFREFEGSIQGKFGPAQGGVANFIGPILPWLALAAFSVRRREALLFAFFWVAFIIMYYALFPGGLTHYWYRYQHIFLPAIIVFGSAGLVSLVRGRAFRLWDVVSAGVVGVVLLAAVALQFDAFRNHYAFDVNLNESRGVALANYLRDEVPPGATIATHDIGAIGFYTDREVIDLVGLIEPDVVDFHNGRRLREYVDDVQPDYIVVFPSWEKHLLQIGLAEDPELFEQVRSFPGGVEPFVVYKTHYQ